MYEQMLEKWRNAILSDEGYKDALKKSKPGSVKRRELLETVLTLYENRILTDIKEKRAGKRELVSCMGSEESAYLRANAFGADFILSMREPEFDSRPEEEKDAMRYEMAFFNLIWDRIYAELMVP